MITGISPDEPVPPEPPAGDTKIPVIINSSFAEYIIVKDKNGEPVVPASTTRRLQGNITCYAYLVEPGASVSVDENDPLAYMTHIVWLDGDGIVDETEAGGEHIVDGTELYISFNAY